MDRRLSLLATGAFDLMLRSRRSAVPVHFIVHKHEEKNCRQLEYYLFHLIFFAYSNVL